MADLRSVTALLALMGLPGVGPAKALAVARGETETAAVDPDDVLPTLLKQAENAVEVCEAADITVLGAFDEDFPGALLAIPQAPAVLYVRGSTNWPSTGLAVVGTREPTTFGRTATSDLTRAAASKGIPIISGLALGIDGIAHEAALTEGAQTIAVLGCGLDIVRPKVHQDLADRILSAGGSLISEQPLGVEPGPRTLVARNRLQSGLASALLVGQTGVVGGTLHTVRFAAQQGRPIFCPVPHKTAEQSAGNVALLESPARDLPDLMPAWKAHRSLAEKLGESPLALPVTSGSVDQWLDQLTGMASGTRPPQDQEQTTLDI